MHTQRLAALAAGLAAAPLALLIVGLDPRLLWEPRQLLLVLVAPAAFVALSHGAGAPARAVGLALSRSAADRPPDARESAGAVLRELGGLSIAVGAAAFTLELVRLLTLLAAAAGQANPTEVVVGLGAALVGPLWGVALKLLVFDPLATAVEPAPGELAALL